MFRELKFSTLRTFLKRHVQCPSDGTLAVKPFFLFFVKRSGAVLCNLQRALRACQENRVESVAHPVSSPQLPRVNFGSTTFETVCFSFLSFWLGPTPGKMTMTVFVKSRNISSRQENVRFAHSNFLRVCILRR